MKISFLVQEDFINYQKPSMFVGAPTCTMKCGKENCQNRALTEEELLIVNDEEICNLYINNPLTEAIVFGGLEPLDSIEELYNLCEMLRDKYKCNDDIVIYTGYTEDEMKDNLYLKKIINLGNIIIKYGRFIANDEPHYDKILGVKLASKNQYAVYYGGRND